MESGLKPRGLLLEESSNAIFLLRSNCGELETSAEKELNERKKKKKDLFIEHSLFC